MSRKNFYLKPGHDKKINKIKRMHVVSFWKVWTTKYWGDAGAEPEFGVRGTKFGKVI